MTFWTREQQSTALLEEEEPGLTCRMGWEERPGDREPI